MARSRRISAGAALLLALLASAALVPVASSSAPPGDAALVRPSVVLVVTDDQTVEGMERMPYLSSRGDWHRFTRAYVNNSLCCPSRATILTGQYDTRTGVQQNAQTGRFRDTQTLAVWLRQAGYRTGLFGKYLNGYPGVFKKGDAYVPPGWSDWHAAWNHLTQYDYKMNTNGVVSTFGSDPEDYLVDVLRERAVDFIRSTPADQPFFLYFAPTSTHSPWKPAPRHVSAFSGVTVPRYPNANEADVSDKPAWVRALPKVNMTTQDNQRRRAWRAALSIDDAMRAIDEQLAASGRSDNTVVIFISDNGLTFGSHRWANKRCEFEECHHVPLLVRHPGTAGQVHGELVGNIDLAPTISALAGATPGAAQDGISLVPLLTGAAVPGWRTGLLQHWPGGDQAGKQLNHPVPASYGIRTHDFRYVELATGERELYDLRTDPFELQNVAGWASYASIRSSLSAQLAALKSQSTG